LTLPDDAENFKVSDEVWQRFVAHVEGLEQVPYASRTSQAFDQLRATAEKELLSGPNAEALNALESGLKARVVDDLKRHEAEIRDALATELVIHCFNTTGEYRYGLRHDPVAQRAIDLLESGEVNRILAPSSGGQGR
jgi:hypothetical protein